MSLVVINKTYMNFFPAPKHTSSNVYHANFYQGALFGDGIFNYHDIRVNSVMGRIALEGNISTIRLAHLADRYSL